LFNQIIGYFNFNGKRRKQRKVKLAKDDLSDITEGTKKSDNLKRRRRRGDMGNEEKERGFYLYEEDINTHY
jgi:hypothetical protein